ncbi:DUF4367 domain-containing protein [Patescibacteria group bacterium]|nr:DUF4367 domain-containing protein [Patescibacteria group bacterium]
MQPTRASIKINGLDYEERKPMPVSMDIIAPRQRTPSAHSQPHHVSKQPQPTHTLMRSAVTKPQKTARLVSQAYAPLDIMDQKPLITTPTYVGNVDKRLLRRAQSFAKSQKISRFGAFTRSAQTTSQVMPNTTSTFQAQAIASPTPTGVLERALENAASHTQPKLTKKELRALHGKRRKHTHLAAAGLIGIMALVVLAYAIYANMPGVMVKVASVHAGFAAVLPSQRPSGYSLASIEYDPGVVRFDFKSNVDSRSYTLTEHSSSWNTAALVSNVVIPLEGSNYHKIDVNNNTIYLFGNDQAAWIKKGVWYQLSGSKNSLSTNQIIKLALAS